MESFFSRYKNVLVLIVVLLAQVVGLAVQIRHPVPGAPETGQNRLIRYWVVSLISPPEHWVHATGSGLRGMWSNYAYLRGVRRQNRDLKAEVQRLRIEQAGLLEDARQGQRLQQILSFKEHYISATQPAQVIGTSGSDVSHVLYLDKGSRDGLKPDMPVITPDGIVGKLKEVLPHTSQLLVISDQTSGAGVVLETSRIRGVLRGNLLGQPEIVNIARDDRIKVGERILTSGGDGVYPRGLPVGVVERTIPDPDHDGYVAVVVRTAANLAQLEEVLVITRVSDQMPALEQQDINRSAIEVGPQKRAADILSERLPGLKDPNAAAPAVGAAPETTGGDPGRPPKPGVSLHPDRFSPSTARPANSSIPLAAAPPVTPVAGTGGAVARKPAAVHVGATAGAASSAPSKTTPARSGATTGVTRPQTVPGASVQAVKASPTPVGVTPAIAAPRKASPALAGTTPGTTAPRKPRVVSPDGSILEPVQPKLQPKPAQPKPQPQTAAPAAPPPGGRL